MSSLWQGRVCSLFIINEGVSQSCCIYWLRRGVEEEVEERLAACPHVVLWLVDHSYSSSKNPLND